MYVHNNLSLVSSDFYVKIPFFLQNSEKIMHIIRGMLCVVIHGEMPFLCPIDAGCEIYW
jgi:hypothetical protein